MHKLTQHLLSYLLKTRRRAQGGFTIAELLIGVTIGAFLLTGMMYLVVEMMRVERTQTARGETEREMAQALDYMAAELREAVLVYDYKCLGVDGSGGGPACLNLNTTVGTVLAFWKREPVPDLNFFSTVTSGTTEKEKEENYANAPACTGNVDCNSVMNYVRTQYTFVSYLLCPNPGRPGPNCGATTTTQPRGPARIVRRYFRQYVWGNSPDGFVNRLANRNPLDNPIWPPNFLSFGGPNSDSEILVANVDWQGPRVPVNCPNGYVSSTGTSDSNIGFSSFYACVRQRTQGDNAGSVQDVFVFLRGNAAERAGLRQELETSGSNLYRPAVETQVRTRGSYERQPSS
ncbi:MAG: prepilin-type N-terminal cleavage/methylation domain-containing protein [Gloeomargarita sp. DG02_1_bins_92]